MKSNIALETIPVEFTFPFHECNQGLLFEIFIHSKTSTDIHKDKPQVLFLLLLFLYSQPRIRLVN